MSGFCCREPNIPPATTAADHADDQPGRAAAAARVAQPAAAGHTAADGQVQLLRTASTTAAAGRHCVLVAKLSHHVCAQARRDRGTSGLNSKPPTTTQPQQRIHTIYLIII